MALSPVLAVGFTPRPRPDGSHHWPLEPLPLREVSTTACRLLRLPSAASTALSKLTSLLVGLKLETLEKMPSELSTPAAVSRLAWSLALFQAEWPASMYTLALLSDDFSLVTAYDRPLLRSASWLLD